MLPLVEDNREALEAICRRYGVRRLELFGSAATGEGYDPQRSDLDFLVEFDRTDTVDIADRYFGLWDDLKELFGSDVDLVTVGSLRNPYFIRAVEATRRLVYGSEEPKAS